ncbi:hypothetical protein HID58_059931, partial [Brassica napus]
MLLLNLYPIHKTKSNCLLNLNRFISIVNFGGEAGDRELPRRTFERHSGTGREGDIKSEEAGRGNWGTPGEEVVVVETEEVAGVETEKPAGDEVAADANKENTAEVEEQKESEDKGSDKEKHKDDKEDKAKKAVKINECLKPDEGDVVVVTGKVLLVVDLMVTVVKLRLPLEILLSSHLLGASRIHPWKLVMSPSVFFIKTEVFHAECL